VLCVVECHGAVADVGVESDFKVVFAFGTVLAGPGREQQVGELAQVAAEFKELPVGRVRRAFFCWIPGGSREARVTRAADSSRVLLLCTIVLAPVPTAALL